MPKITRGSVLIICAKVCIPTSQYENRFIELESQIGAYLLLTDVRVPTKSGRHFVPSTGFSIVEEFEAAA
jgi:hypothetical protein